MSSEISEGVKIDDESGSGTGSGTEAGTILISIPYFFTQTTRGSRTLTRIDGSDYFFYIPGRISQKTHTFSSVRDFYIANVLENPDVYTGEFDYESYVKSVTAQGPEKIKTLLFIESGKTSLDLEAGESIILFVSDEINPDVSANYVVVKRSENPIPLPDNIEIDYDSCETDKQVLDMTDLYDKICSERAEIALKNYTVYGFKNIGFLDFFSKNVSYFGKTNPPLYINISFADVSYARGTPMP